MNTHFTDLFEYNHFANSGFLPLLLPTAQNDKANQLFSHILNAHHIWNHRLIGKNPRFTVFQEHNPNDFKAIDRDNHQLTHDLIEEGLIDQCITYQNSKGNSFTNTRKDILTHIVNHSTYHRGQIAQLIAADSTTPPNTDFIFYKRDGLQL